MCSATCVHRHRSITHIVRAIDRPLCTFFFFFFNDTATTEIYTLSLHDALPISMGAADVILQDTPPEAVARRGRELVAARRSEEHTSELQSQSNLVCRLLLEKKKKVRHLQLHYDTLYPSIMLDMQDAQHVTRLLP